jgi:hypothetical protein
VVGEGFERGAVAEGGVQPPAVVEHFDVFGDGEAGSRSSGPAVPVVHLVLQCGEEALGARRPDPPAGRRLTRPMCDVVGLVTPLCQPQAASGWLILFALPCRSGT